MMCNLSDVRFLSSLFVNTALLLWAFDISEDQSSPIDTMAFTDGVVAHPHPFELKFKARVPVEQILESNE